MPMWQADRPALLEVVGQADSLPYLKLSRCARPWPILDALHQRRLDRIPLYIPDDPIHLHFAADPMIIRLVLPESLTGSCEDLIGLSSAVTLDCLSDLFHLDERSQQDVDVIRHDDPGLEVVFLPNAVA